MFLKFVPQFKQVLWGGDRILPFKHMQSTLKGVGESWELSGVKNSLSVVAGGPYDGLTLPALMEKMQETLMGSRYATFGGTFPLLIKFIDANQDLSLQVHPNDALAMKRCGSLGKTEMWYVVDAREGATLCSGFAREVPKEDYEAWVHSAHVMEAVAHHPLHKGDVFFLPAGRVHSIGAGAFIAEIQQTSDITYRLYDFGRVDAKSGKPRQLHIEEAREAIDFTVEKDYLTPYTPCKNHAVPLVKCNKFTTSLLHLDAPYTADYRTLDSFVIYMCIEGACLLADDEGEKTVMASGETVLVPAAVKQVVIEPQKSVKLLEVHI